MSACILSDYGILLVNLYFIVYVFLLGPSTETPENIDYDFAQAELMMQQMGNDPIQEAIESIEKQHEEDKAGKQTNK